MQTTKIFNENKAPEAGCAGFKVNNSWIYFDNRGYVWIEEYGQCRAKGLNSVQAAISWVDMYGDRD